MVGLGLESRCCFLVAFWDPEVATEKRDKKLVLSTVYQYVLVEVSCSSCSCIVTRHRIARFFACFFPGAGAWPGVLEDVPNAQDRVRPSGKLATCLLYTSPSPRDLSTSRMPSSA